MNNLANVFGLISHFFWRKTDNIILRAGQFLRVGNSQLKDDKLGIGTASPDAIRVVGVRQSGRDGDGQPHVHRRHDVNVDGGGHDGQQATDADRPTEQRGGGDGRNQRAADSRPCGRSRDVRGAVRGTGRKRGAYG